ncbi:hypothetical protein MA16_Dca022002 [Dendrobium catenatum]|uniref:Uncharacterized protein n=1 Tax=Dendrobium catenatum TaxID=906689 RepID=A0A2I0X9Y4_9ASPA|nr:hypothetical protein MA16_Dca022002 [Dendrobium catenatum]
MQAKRSGRPPPTHAKQSRDSSIRTTAPGQPLRSRVHRASGFSCQSLSHVNYNHSNHRHPPIIVLPTIVESKKGCNSETKHHRNPILRVGINARVENSQPGFLGGTIAKKSVDAPFYLAIQESKKGCNSETKHHRNPILRVGINPRVENSQPGFLGGTVAKKSVDAPLYLAVEKRGGSG